jgi:hypothetical protein
MAEAQETIVRFCDFGCGRSVDGFHYSRLTEANGVSTETKICKKCHNKDRDVKFNQDKEITTDLLMDCSMDRIRLESRGSLKAEEALVDSCIRDHVERTQKAMDELIGEFRRRHWMGGLCKRIEHSTYRGLSGKTRDFEVLTYAMAGRVMITIKDRKPKGKGKFGGGMVTLITADGDITARLNIQGICATAEEAIGLLWHATYHLPVLKVDKKVSIF